jgi:hypothetical protein
MANEELVQAVKKIVALARDGKHDDAYVGWKSLFSGPAFAAYDAADQRQALKLMVLAKNAPQQMSDVMIAAHAAAIAPLDKLVAAHREPADHELLGLCLAATGDTARASEVFRAGLTLERARDPGSDLCGSLMKRVSLI